jgi:hypothetical protein
MGLRLEIRLRKEKSNAISQEIEIDFEENLDSCQTETHDGRELDETGGQ